MQRHLLYRTCMVPIATYGLRLWYFDGACNKAACTTCLSMQHQAALWITGAFKTSPTGAIEAIAGLTPMHILLRHLSSWAKAYIETLSLTHLLWSMMGRPQHTWESAPHP